MVQVLGAACTEVVKCNNLITSFQERINKMAADEAGTTCDNDSPSFTYYFMN